jgi:hypothetical protein
MSEINPFDDGSNKPKRWMAELHYRGQDEPAVVSFEEIYQLHMIVERGPDWNLLDRVVVTLNRPSVEPQREQRA